MKRLSKLSLIVYPMEHKVANQALLTLELSLQRMPFEWNIDNMRSILTLPSESEEDDPLPEPAFEPPLCEISIGKHYIIAPSAAAGLEDGADNFPFYIGCVKGVSERDAQENVTGYNVQWLEPSTRCNGKSFNRLDQWVETAYQTRDTDNRPANIYDHVPKENFCQEISITGAGTGTKRKRCKSLTIYVKGDQGHRAATAWGIRLGKGRNVHNNYSDYTLDKF